MNSTLTHTQTNQPTITTNSAEHVSDALMQFAWVSPGPSDAELLAIRAALSQHLTRTHGRAADGS